MVLNIKSNVQVELFIKSILFQCYRALFHNFFYLNSACVLEFYTQNNFLKSGNNVNLSLSAKAIALRQS